MIMCAFTMMVIFSLSSCWFRVSLYIGRRQRSHSIVPPQKIPTEVTSIRGLQSVWHIEKCRKIFKTPTHLGLGSYITQ